jgi:hypothetical protein
MTRLSFWHNTTYPLKESALTMMTPTYFSCYRMFGYNLAAAHLGLRHVVAHSFAVSDVYSGGEGWPLIDAVPPEDVCHNFPPSEYPHVIHYCHHYHLGKVRPRYPDKHAMCFYLIDKSPHLTFVLSLTTVVHW